MEFVAMSGSPFWTMLTGRVIAFSLSITLYGCGMNDEFASRLPDASATVASLTDVTELVGLRSESNPGDISDYELPRIMGVGGGLFDYDGDGDLDVLLIGVGSWPPGSSKLLNSSRLFRQDETGHFADVSAASGLVNSGYGMGQAIGDADNDGDLDVFFTNYGEDRFFVNRADGTFIDHTSAAGVSDPNWSTAASFFDYDRDGWLDADHRGLAWWRAAIRSFSRGSHRPARGTPPRGRSVLGET